MTEAALHTEAADDTIAAEDLLGIFPHFYGNPIIGELAQSPRWTISGQLDPDNPHKRKAPIDIRELKDNERLRGAYEKTSNCLMDLEELTEFLPRAANHAFALNAHLDEVLVLDIEKDCPPALAHELLRLPALYRELSMSGRGYHLVLPLPANFHDFPIAAAKKRLQEKHGWYEILIDHWITFTRTPAPPVAPHDDETGMKAWSRLYARLAGEAVEARTVAIDVSESKPEIPGEEEVIYMMTRDVMPKTVEDFHGDHSRFEFSVLSVLHSRLAPAIPFLEQEYDTEYTASLQAWLLYEAATRTIEHRAKHDELRNGMPLLLNAATDLLSRREAQRLENATTAAAETSRRSSIPSTDSESEIP